MRGDFFFDFRGEERCVEFDVDFSGPGSGCSCDWWFKDMTPEQHDDLKINAFEDEQISRIAINTAYENATSDSER